MPGTNEQAKPLLDKEEEEVVNDADGVCSLSNVKKVTMGCLAASNGILYFAVARAGGQNLQQFLSFQSDAAMNTLSLAACPCYGMFFYKTLEFLKIKPTNIAETALSMLAPFAASAFLTAGIEGITQMGWPNEAAVAIGVILFILRMVNCIDGSIKFPGRILEMKDSGDKAWSEGDYKELSRLVLTGLTSLGFSLCSTDAICAATKIILGWFGVGPGATLDGLSYTSGVLGAIGLFPMSLYWTHRGIKQLTLGGEVNEKGVNPDPTDKYTYWSILPVLPVTLGILGSATSAGGSMFGKLGMFSEIVRIASSSVYSIAGGVPGLSTLLRGTFSGCETRKTSTVFEKLTPGHPELNLGASP